MILPSGFVQVAFPITCSGLCVYDVGWIGHPDHRFHCHEFGVAVRFSITFLLALACCELACGQIAQPPQETTTIHVLADLIEVPVLAFKLPFRLEPGLTKSQFVIRLDGGTPFHPSHVRLEGAEPLNLSVVVEADTKDIHSLSQSFQSGMESWSPTLFNDSDRVSFYIYGCRLVRSLKEERASPKDSRDKLVRAVALPAFQSAMEGGRSCPRPPLDRLLETVMDQTADAGSWNVILLIVNAEHKADLKQFERVRAFAAAKRVTVFAIKYLATDRFPASVYSGSEVVNRLVAAVGGITLHSALGELGEVTDTMIEDVRQRYIVSFPRPGNGSQGAHYLQITSTAKGVRVLSSAASAPLLETGCASGKDRWLCSQQRPQYGNQVP
jgi:hypothetical protein